MKINNIKKQTHSFQTNEVPASQGTESEVKEVSHTRGCHLESQFSSMPTTSISFSAEPSYSLADERCLADISLLLEAVDGFGTDEATVFQVFERATPEEREAIEFQFDKLHGETHGSLRQVLYKEFSGKELDRAMFALERGRTGPSVQSQEFQKLLDERTGSRCVGENKVDILFDGVESFAARDRLIDSATKTICLQTFHYNADETGWLLAKKLVEKAKQGVDVRVIADALGSNFTNKFRQTIFKYMQRNGVEVRLKPTFDPSRFTFNERLHEKHLIIDGKVSIEGGMNIGDEYAFGGTGRKYQDGEKEAWRDVDILLEGPVVEENIHAFVKNWNAMGGELSDSDILEEPCPAQKENVDVRVVQHRPIEDGDQNTTELYLQAIRSSKHSIQIESAYFVPPRELKYALMNAALRGVRVQILTNSRESNDFPAVTDASRYHYEDLLEAGVELYEKEGAVIHSKTCSVDSQLAIVGSSNLNGRSQFADTEFVVAAFSNQHAKELEQRFSQGLEVANEVTFEELEEESSFENARQWTLATFGGKHL